MFFRILLLLILVPILDFALLVRVARAIHWGPTLALCVLTGLLGAGLARWQGFRTLQAIQADLAAGKMPGARLADGALILFAGAALFFPGFLTDLMGFILLIPPSRRWIRQRLTRYLSAHIQIITPEDLVPDVGPRPLKYVRNEAMRDADSTADERSRP